MKNIFDYLDVINVFVLMVFFIIGNENNVMISFIFVILIGFGFGTSGVINVSVNRNNKDKLSEIVSSITILKLLLFIIALLFIIPLLFFFEDASNDKILYLTTLWVCVNEVLFPSFYFQGIEKMKYFSIISLITRSISVVLIFLFIESKEDYLLVPFFYLLGAFLSGFSALFIVFYSLFLREELKK